MSDDEFLPRHLIPELEEALGSSRIVNLIEVGKTTLVKDFFKQGEYITLDKVAVLTAMDLDRPRRRRR